MMQTIADLFVHPFWHEASFETFKYGKITKLLMYWCNFCGQSNEDSWIINYNSRFVLTTKLHFRTFYSCNLLLIEELTFNIGH